MKNPWTVEDAFDVMFCDDIDYTTVDGKRSGIKCSIFPIEQVDPFLEYTNETNLRMIRVLVRVLDFHCAFGQRNKPKVGDTLKTIDGLNWKVADS